jgi:hypothetical protein
VARIRTIKPEFWGDEKLAPLSPITRLVFLGLISMADDRGRLTDNQKRIDAFIFPETSETSRGSLGELSAIGRIRRGLTASGQRVIEIANWRHQKIEKPNYLGALPDIVQELTDDSPTSRGGIGEASGNDRGGVGDVSVSVSVSAISTDILLANDANAPSPSELVSTRKPAKKPAAYPHFPVALCQQLHGLWVSTFGACDYPRFRKELGPLFTLAEADRPAEAPTNSELAAALKSYADLAPLGVAARFANVNHAAGCLAAIARTRRELADDPSRRSDAVMRIIHGKVAA